MKERTVQVYKNNQYIGDMIGSTENIAHLIGGADVEENYKIVDKYDNLILTSIGFFLDTVPNQKWLQSELLPLLQQVQFGQIPLEEVEIRKEV
jgi:hypothetical protein